MPASSGSASRASALVARGAGAASPKGLATVTSPQLEAKAGLGGSEFGFGGLTVSTLMSPKSGPAAALGIGTPQGAALAGGVASTVTGDRARLGGRGAHATLTPTKPTTATGTAGARVGAVSASPSQVAVPAAIGTPARPAAPTGSSTPSNTSLARARTGAASGAGRGRGPSLPSAGTGVERRGLPQGEPEQKADPDSEPEGEAEVAGPRHGARLPPRMGPGDRSRPRNFTRLALPLVLPERLLASVGSDTQAGFDPTATGSGRSTEPEMVTAVEVAVASQNAVGWSNLSSYSHPVYIKSLPTAQSAPRSAP